MNAPIVRAFISHAHDDRAAAGQAQQVLRDAGISPFLAHEDLEVSDDWPARILLELGACDLFVPLLSKSFVSSTWAQQEAGFIVSRLPGVVVAPLSLDGTRIGGFLAHIQCPSVRGGITQSLLVEPLISRFPRTILPRLIATAVKAGSFRHAEALISPLVRFFPVFSLEEATAFAEGAIGNGQIWFASRCRSEYLPEFLRIQGSALAPKTLLALTHQVEHGEWHREE